jgi:flavin-dependent dehydrogenase
LLVDHKQELTQKIHTTGIFVRRTLEDFDIPPDCLGPAVRHVTLHSPARRTLQLESSHDEFRIGRMGKLYLRFLEQAQRIGVEWLPGARYAGHTKLKNDVVIRLDLAGSSRWVKARYLVGADGANSKVARALSLDTNTEWIVGIEDVFRDVPLAGAPELHCFLDRRLAPGYLAWVANDGEETHVGVGGYANLFDPTQALDEFRSSLKQVVDLGNASLVERRGGRIPVGGVLRRIANSEGLLVGDAAGAVSPLTAGGLDPCMRLSTLAAKVISDYLATSDPASLANYSGELFRARFTSRLWMRRLLAHANQPSLELTCRALRLPLLNHFAAHVFFGRGSFPDVESPSPAVHLKPAPSPQ